MRVSLVCVANVLDSLSRSLRAVPLCCNLVARNIPVQEMELVVVVVAVVLVVGGGGVVASGAWLSVVPGWLVGWLLVVVGAGVVVGGCVAHGWWVFGGWVWIGGWSVVVCLVVGLV